MKKITFILFALVCSLGFSQTFTDSGGPYDMQNGNGTTAATCGTADELTLPLAVNGIGILGGTNSIESVTLNVTHTWSDDIVISLQDPSGATTVLLIDDKGGQADGIAIILQDGATPLPDAGGDGPALTGTFAPDEALGGFNLGTDADGTWNLLVCDDAGGDIGAVDSWSITFAPTPSCSTPSGATVDNITVSSADFSWDDVATATLGFEWGILAPGGDPDVDSFLFSGATGTAVLMDTETGLSDFTDYVFYVRSNCDTAGFSSWSSGTAFSTPALPPANDECDAAIALTVNADLACGVVTSGTTAGGTASPQPDDATGTPDNDVWFTFEATGAQHQISLLNIVAVIGTSTDMGMSVFDDAAGCNMMEANEVGESDPNTLSLSGLTGGNTYYVRVYGWSSTTSAQATFDVCVGTPPMPPANDECDASVALTVNADYECGVVTSGTTVSATASPQPDDATGTPNNDVWFTFTATNDEHRISLLNVLAVVGTATDMGMSVFDDAAGCNMTAANEVGESDPNTLDLTGLTDGNTYYLRVYGWSSSNTTTAQTTFDVCVGTPPTCFIPENLATVFVAPDSADLSWTAPTSGTAPADYNWEVVPQGNAQGDGIVSSGTTADLFATATGLTLDTLYDLRVQSNCGTGDLSAWSPAFTFNAGYCIPTGTSTSTYIDNFSTSGDNMNISNLASGLATNNYENNSATMAASGAPNDAIDFEVEIVGGTVGCAVWVDWNNDFVFDVSEVSFSTTAYGNGPFTGTVTIPDATPDGDYRMRVMIDWNDNNPGDDAPCSYASATTPRGETEDYTLTVDATLSIDEVENQSAFTYFPNPVKNTLTLNAQNAIDNVTIINMLGQEVLRTSPNNINSVIDMSELQSGTYFVKVTVNTVSQTVRVIKQ